MWISVWFVFVKVYIKVVGKFIVVVVVEVLFM